MGYFQITRLVIHTKNLWMSLYKMAIARYRTDENKTVRSLRPDCLNLCSIMLLVYIAFFTRGGVTPMLYQVKANWSAFTSIALERLEEPCPDFVSMRINTGLSPT